MLDSARTRPLPWRAIVAALVLGVTASLVTLGWIASPVRVRGRSMEPALHPGDVVLVVKTKGAIRRVNAGDVVLARVPSPSGPVLVVKRVRRVDGDDDVRALELEGDASARSHDSRAFGAIDARDVVGVVVARLAPSPGAIPARARDASRQPRAEGNRDARSPAGR